MAKKPETAVETAPENTKHELPVEAAQKPAEAVYMAAEFAQNAARLFGDRATADIVTAAFKVAGRRNATLTEARCLVEQFMNKEVR